MWPFLCKLFLYLWSALCQQLIVLISFFLLLETPWCRAPDVTQDGCDQKKVNLARVEPVQVSQ